MSRVIIDVYIFGLDPLQIQTTLALCTAPDHLTQLFIIPMSVAEVYPHVGATQEHSRHH